MAETVNIFDELKQLESTELTQLERINLYAYPEGYFDELAENTLRNIWFQSLPVTLSYSVPFGYFENFPELMLDKLALQSIYTNDFLTETYKVPEGYFNNLANNIIEKIKKQNDSVDNELKEIAPLLSKISKVNVYTIPENYFERQLFVTEKNVSKPAKVVSIISKTRKWFNYAAAACVAAALFAGGYFYVQNKFSNNNPTGKNLADINVRNAISQLSDSTINNYLQSDNSDAYASPGSDNEDLNIQTLIENASDEEIENYLMQNPESGEESKGI